MSDRCDVVVLISGSGSNLQALIDSSSNADSPARIRAVISNRADAYGLERARQAGSPPGCSTTRSTQAAKPSMRRWSRPSTPTHRAWCCWRASCASSPRLRAPLPGAPAQYPPVPAAPARACTPPACAGSRRCGARLQRAFRHRGTRWRPSGRTGGNPGRVWRYAGKPGQTGACRGTPYLPAGHALVRRRSPAPGRARRATGWPSAAPCGQQLRNRRFCRCVVPCCCSSPCSPCRSRRPS